MNVYVPVIKPLALLLAIVAFAASGFTASAEDEFSFSVTNATRERIIKILVSEDKETWGQFDVGDGIKAGDTVTLVWDKSTNNEACKQWVKAVYAGGEEAEPAKFDFCEEGLAIEFE